jgi:hypothetical protein
VGGTVNDSSARMVILAAGLGLAGGVAYLATRAAGPVQLTQYTELREGPLQEHLVTAAELGTIPATARHHYPDRVAPGITQLVQKGFAPLYRPCDPQVAARPAERAW